MKKIIFFLLLVFVITILILINPFQRSNQAEVEFIDTSNRKGVALIITGAAARISQEVALLEELDRRGLLNNIVFISGVSSGALNSVVLNGILDKKITWDEYKDLLFKLKTSDIFIQNGKKIPVNTSPARALYTKIAEERLGFRTMGDLEHTTSITITRFKNAGLKRIDYRICSLPINKESDTSMGLVDIMMATSAFPVVFPPVKIKNATTIPDGYFVDGGAGNDRVPYRALMEFEKYRGIGVEKVYIVSRNCDSMPDLSEELRGIGINDKGIFDKLGFSLDVLLTKELIKKLNQYTIEAPELSKRTYIWIPDFKADFLLFNFDDLEKQYSLTKEWAEKHNPVLLEDYLKLYSKTKK